MGIRVFSFLFAILLLASPLVQVVRSDMDTSEVIAEDESGELGIVGAEAQDFSDSSLTAAPGVDTICVFPKNPTRLVLAGEETELLVGLHNEGSSDIQSVPIDLANVIVDYRKGTRVFKFLEILRPSFSKYSCAASKVNLDDFFAISCYAESTLNALAIRASLHFPFDHRMFVQNLTVAEFYKAAVPPSAQATFPYVFAVSKYLQPGPFDLVGTIIYEIDQHPYQSVFYNGTIEVVEAGGIFSIESVFLVTLGVALLGLLGVWAYGRIQDFSKKTKRAPKVEVGTRATEANMDEWLEGTAYAKSLSNKSKKKN